MRCGIRVNHQIKFRDAASARSLVYSETQRSMKNTTVNEGSHTLGIISKQLHNWYLHNPIIFTHYVLSLKTKFDSHITNKYFQHSLFINIFLYIFYLTLQFQHPPFPQFTKTLLRFHHPIKIIYNVW